MSLLKLKPELNKSNGQIRISLPKRLMSEELKENLEQGKVSKLKMRIEGFDLI